MRRVLIVIPGPTWGGSANTAQRLHQPLLERGWEIRVVLPPEGPDVVERLRASGIEVHVQSMHRLRATASPGPHLALARHTGGEIRALRDIVRRVDAAVVQNHGDLNPQGGIAGHREGRAVHWHLLDTRTPARLRRLTMPMIARLADSISTVGAALADAYPGARDFGERCEIVYPPVDLEPFRRARERRAQARAELGLRDDQLCVGAVGNRNPQKGHQWLVRAMAQVRAQRPDAVLRILGAASPGHEAYEREMRDEAAALGLSEPDVMRVLDPGARVPELIGALDVLCLSSVPRSEGLPTVLLEAMAAGVPVVATDVGAVREAVRPGVSGIVVPPLDAEALAAALLELLAAPRDLAASAQRLVATEYSLSGLADRFAHTYELAVEHRSARKAGRLGQRRPVERR